MIFVLVSTRGFGRGFVLSSKKHIQTGCLWHSYTIHTSNFIRKLYPFHHGPGPPCVAQILYETPMAIKRFGGIKMMIAETDRLRRPCQLLKKWNQSNHNPPTSGSSSVLMIFVLVLTRGFVVSSKKHVQTGYLRHSYKIHTSNFIRKPFQ